MNLRILFDKKLRKLYRKFENVYKKSCAIKSCENSIETLALGSSHGYFGFRAKENSFNLCVESQDLYYSYKLYEKYSNLPNLKNIILFYSVFSTGFEIEKTNSFEDTICYEHFFGIPYKELDPSKLKPIKHLLEDIFDKNKIIKNYRGNLKRYKNTFFDVKERVFHHLRENSRETYQEQFIEKMQEIAKKYNHQLIICIPPARKDYTNLAGDKKYLFRNLYKIKDLNILDYFDVTEFNEKDFTDTDHLNLYGAKKLTKLIKENLCTKKININ